MAVDVPFVFDENFSDLGDYNSDQLEETSASSHDLAGVPPVSSPAEDYVIEILVTNESTNTSLLSDFVQIDSSSNETNVSYETNLIPDFSLVIPIYVTSSSPVYWFKEGNTYYNNSNYQKAIECYDQAINLNPQLEEALCNKGIALCRLGKYQEAINAFDQAINIDQDYSNAWKNKALALEAMEQED